MVRVTQKNRIDEINKNILMMADLVEKQILKSVENLKKYDRDLVEDIMRRYNVWCYKEFVKQFWGS